MNDQAVIRVIVSIDTEEDNRAPTREAPTTRNISQLPGLDRRFEALGVRATYFTNYQVVHQAASAAIMREIHQSGRAEVAARSACRAPSGSAAPCTSSAPATS